MRRINRCLNTRLVEICKRTVQLEELNSKLIGYLPPSLQEHCHVGSFNGGCLVIVANNPVWASQLRYSVPELRDKLRKEAGIYQLTSIKVTVAAVEVAHFAKRNTTTPTLTTKARETLIAGGDQCSYQPLREALHGLAGVKDDATV